MNLLFQSSMKDKVKVINAPFLNNDIVDLIIQCLTDLSDDGATTRNVSDYCDISVYSARHWLMKMEEKHMVRSFKHSEKVSKWYLEQND